MPTTEPTQMRPDAPPSPGSSAEGEPERLVRSRAGRLVPESQLAGPPVPEAAKPMHPALKAALGVGAVVVVALALLVVFDTRHGGARDSVESFFRDFGYVVREKRGPGLGR